MEGKVKNFGHHAVIESSKILRISSKDTNFDWNKFYIQPRILYLDKFLFDEIFIFLSKIDFCKFPNLFVLKIHVDPIVDLKNVENKLNLLELPSDRYFLIEITRGRDKLFYSQNRLDKKFKAISENYDWNAIGRQNFFAILKHLNLSLIDVDLGQIRSVVDSELMSHFDLSDSLFLNILKLFDLKFTQAAIVEIIEKNDYEAFLVAFDENTKNTDKYFLRCIQHENLKCFKFLLERVKISFETWQNYFKLAKINKILEFCDALNTSNPEYTQMYQRTKRIDESTSRHSDVQRFAYTDTERPLDIPPIISSESYDFSSLRGEKVVFRGDGSTLKPPKFQSPETIEKIISKCRINSEKCEKIASIVKKVADKSDMQLLLEVIASHDSIIFDFNCDIEKVQSSNYLMNLPEYKNGLSYVTINCHENEKLSQFAYEIAKNAFKIIFRDENFLLSANLRLREFKEELNNDGMIEKLALHEIFAKHFHANFGEKSQKNENVQVFFDIYVRLQLEKLDANKIRALNRKLCVTQRLEDAKIKIKRKSFQIPDDKLVFIKSNIPRAVLGSLYYDSVKDNFLSEVENLFIDLRLLVLNEINEEFKEIASSSTIKKIFIDASVINENSIEILKSVDPKAQIIVVGHDEVQIQNFSYKLIKKNYKWSDLSEKTQNFLLKRKIIFQNHQVALEDVFGAKVDKLSADLIKILCSDQQLVINSQANDENFAYVPWEFKIKNEIFFDRSTRNFNDDYYYSSNVSIDDLIKKVVTSQIVLLTGIEKSGKSNAMKTITKKYVTHSYEKFVYLFTYDREKNEEIYLDYVKKNIRCNEDKLAFGEKYEQGNTIIFIDEIDLNEKENIEKLLEDFLKCKGNQLWIATDNFDGDKIEEKFSTLRVKLAVPTIGEFTRIAKEYNNIALKYTDFTSDEKQVFQYYALRVYFNTNEEIFGLRFTKDKIKKDSLILESDKNNNLSFTNAFWVEFLIADFISTKLKAAEVESEFFDFFLKILKGENFLRTREFINLHNLDKFEENQLISIGNSLRDAICRTNDVNSCFYSQNYFFELAGFIIKILRKAENFSSLVLTKDILYSTLSHRKLEYELPETINKVKILLSFAIDGNKEILLHPNQENETLIHKLTEISNNENLIRWMIEEKKYEKRDVLSDENISLYEICITNENLKLYEYFLQIDNLSLDAWKELLEISFFSEKFEFYKETEKFGREKFADKSTQEIEKFQSKFNEISKFRNDIENGLCENVINFIENNPKLKICKGKTTSLSAIEHAKEKEKFEILKILIKNNFKVPDFKDGDAFEFYLDLYFHENIRESMRTKNYHKCLLLSKLSTPTNTSMISHYELQTMIDELFEYEDVVDVLKTVASTDVEIIFTMSQKNVADFYPKAKNANGVYYPSKGLMLVAKCSNLAERYGVFVHEAAHCAFDAMYDNHCKPYLKEDFKRKRIFQEITEKYLEKSKKSEITEPIINSVFIHYENYFFEAELAVRPIQLIAKVRKENSGRKIEEKLNHLKIDFPEIFNFHYDQASKDLSIVDGVPLRMLNDRVGLWNRTLSQNLHFNNNQKLSEFLNNKENLKIFSEYPNLVLRSVFNALFTSPGDSLFKIKSENLFINLNDLWVNEYLFEKFMTLTRSEAVQRIIINCAGLDVSNTNFMGKLRKISKKKIFINPHPNHETFSFINCEFSFSWEEKLDELSFNSQSGAFVVHLCPSLKFKIDALVTEVEFNSTRTKLVDLLTHIKVDEEMLNILNELNEKVSLNEEKFQIYFDERIFQVKEDNGNFNPHKLGFLYARLKNLKKKFIMLCDSVESGKTEALKNIYKKFLMKNSRHEFWILFITQEEIGEFNYDYIMKKTKSNIEHKIFKKYWNENKIILLVDGIDCLDHNQQWELLNFIQIPNFKQVFIACGLHLEVFLKSLLNECQVISLQPLDAIQEVELLRKKDLNVKFRSSSIPFLLLVNLKDISDIDILNLYQIHQKYNDHVFAKCYNTFDKTLPMNFETIYFYVHFYAALKPFNNLRILNTFGPILKLIGNLKRFALIDPITFTIFDKVNSNFWVAEFLKTFLLRDDEFFNDHEGLIIFFQEILETFKYEPIIEMLDQSLIGSTIGSTTATSLASVLRNEKYKNLLSIISSPSFQQKYPGIYNYFYG